MIREIARQLGKHAPYTMLGTLSGVLLIVVVHFSGVPHQASEALFWGFHPAHVLLSALVTTAMYRLHGRGGVMKTLMIGYLGSVGIATLSDSVIPFVGEWLLQLPNRGVHLGLIEKWWLVNPLALLGIGTAWVWPRTEIPHAGHVFVSTWASLFHMTMALGAEIDMGRVLVMSGFLFFAVWIPCCTSDIVFPMLWVKNTDAENPCSGMGGR